MAQRAVAREQGIEVTALFQAAHWHRVGNIGIGGWQGFLASELHFEHHIDHPIMPRMLIRRRPTRTVNLAFRTFAEQRVVPDEEVHRIKVTEWWVRKFDAASPAKRQESAAQSLAADAAIQHNINPYLRDS